MFKLQINKPSYFWLILLLIGCEKKTQLEWEDPTVFEINKEPPRSHFYSYENLKNILSSIK